MGYIRDNEEAEYKLREEVPSRRAQPADVLRVALVALLADLLREAEKNLQEAHPVPVDTSPFLSVFPVFFETRASHHKDAAAIRRVMEILRRGSAE